MKKVLGILFSASLLMNLTACSGSSDLVMPEIQNDANTAEILSMKGMKAEIQKAMTAQFKSLDADKNKFVTPEEFGLKTPADFVQFKELDDNKDGKVTQKEMVPTFFEKTKMALSFKKTADALFKQLDKSRDGFVTTDELDSPLISAQYPELFKKFDKEKGFWIFKKSNPGKLTQSEFENLFANLAMSTASAAPAPAPAPAEPPAPAPADPAQPAPAQP
ncbi:MAG: EF-hand domain-containing protein [Candidatus Sericytochromatia bacterium]